MDDMLQEYIQYEKEHSDELSTYNSHVSNIDTFNEQEYLNYVNQTKQYYYNMGLYDFITAIWFTFSSCYICFSEYVKHKIGWRTRNEAIINVSKRLAAKNMMYVKIFQAFATNRNIVSPELNTFFSEYTDNVKYTPDEYDIADLKELETRSLECYPYRQLRIINDYTPIKSGLMSLIFKGYLCDDKNGDIPSADADAVVSNAVVIKYLRKNIHKNFEKSINKLVVFAKLTKYFPYVKTLNVENLILQNIVSLKDQVCFRKELSNIRSYYNSWKDCTYVKIPEPYGDYTEKVNPDTIVMEFINGMKITEIDPADNDEFGKILATFNAKAAFCTSIFHGDLHPGNILFIKEKTTVATDVTDATDKYNYRIGILDFGIVGRLVRSDQETLFKLMKYMFKRKYNKIVDIIISSEIAECMNPDDDISTLPTRGTALYKQLRKELNNVIVVYTTPEIKFFGVSEMYGFNYILNKYGLIFKRSLYRVFITVAIMDSIGTRLGHKMSYMQHMTDMVAGMFNLRENAVNDADDDAEGDADDE